MILLFFYSAGYDIAVAPFTGAWIETEHEGKRFEQMKSLPSRERGLKLRLGPNHNSPQRSLPSRERGLKHARGSAGAGPRRSLPSRERGLKQKTPSLLEGKRMSLPSRERGLKH